MKKAFLFMARKTSQDGNAAVCLSSLIVDAFHLSFFGACSFVSWSENE
jgi:hypothetical protein